MPRGEPVDLLDRRARAGQPAAPQTNRRTRTHSTTGRPAIADLDLTWMHNRPPSTSTPSTTPPAKRGSKPLDSNQFQGYTSISSVLNSLIRTDKPGQTGPRKVGQIQIQFHVPSTQFFFLRRRHADSQQSASGSVLTIRHPTQMEVRIV